MNNGIFSLFNVDNIQFYQNACKNFLNSYLVCQDCVLSCPKQAIDIKNNIPVIDSVKCTECGLCISKCEVLAFDNIKRPYSSISKQIAEYPDSNITCDNDNNHTKGIKVPCYLNIDLHLLIQISKYRDSISFYVGNCTSCLKVEHNTILNHFINLQNQLNELEISLTINVLNSKLNEANSEVINGLTRRELLQKISLRKLRNFEIIEEGDSNKNKPDKSLLKERILYKRRLLNNYFQEDKKNNAKLIKKKLLVIEEINSCNGCNICERICPTGALSWINHNNSSSLTFDARLCIDCKKCFACPESAIKFKSISFKDYLNTAIKKLTTFKLVKCEDCGEAFRSDDSASLCSLCKKKKEQIKNYFD